MPPPVAGQEGHRPPLQAPGDDGVAGRPKGVSSCTSAPPLQVRGSRRTAAADDGDLRRRFGRPGHASAPTGASWAKRKDSPYGGRWTPSSVTIAVT